MTEAEGARSVAEFARDEILRAKEEAEFARAEAESSNEKAEEEAFESGVAETQALLKTQVPRVCRIYCFQVWNEALQQAGVEASSDLWKVENVYYLPTIREAAPSSSEAEAALEKAETAQPEAALVANTPDEPAKEADPPGVIETDKGPDKEAP